MGTVTKYAGTITQTTGGNFRSFSSLNNMKNGDWNSNSQSSDWIKAKGNNASRPSTLSFTNFNLAVPKGADIKKVTVEYRQGKTAKESGKYPNIGAPTITLLGVSGSSGKGKAPTKDMTYYSKEFKNSKLTRSVVNSNSFGVKLDYPMNSNTNEGKVKVCYVRLKVEYVTSSYTVSLKKVEGEYNEEDYTIQASISNKNLTSYNPSVTITSPLGFTYERSSGTGEITQVNARTFSWNPKLGTKVGTSSIDMTFLPSVTYSGGSDTYTGDFDISEDLNSSTGHFTATIRERPTPPGTVVDDEVVNYYEDDEVFEDSVQTVTAGDDFTFLLHLSQSEYNEIKEFNETQLGITDANLQYFLLFTAHTWKDHTREDNFYKIFLKDLTDNKIILDFTSVSNTGLKPVMVFAGDPNLSGELIRTWQINIIPTEESIGDPLYTVIKLTQEETDRLGDGINYIVESYFKLETSKTYVEQWYKNYRLGVFNNLISENVTVTTETVDGETVETVTDSTDYDDLTPKEIYENADYWSDVLQKANEWENIECEFTYNKNYPVYLVITSQYTEQNATEDIQFITPCIVEESKYQSRTETGIYPTPINSLIDGEGGFAELNIPSFTPIPSLVFQDWPLGLDYGNDDNMAIRGIAITGTIDRSDDFVLYAKLRSPTGLTGERSIVITEESENFTLGGLGDLWGLTTQSLTNLEDWEMELTISDLLNTNDTTLIFGNVQIILYVETIEEQVVTVKIDGEDLAYYGAFIQEITIPEGLNTDTSYLSIDGTDTNDAYRQNIREKEITLKCSIDNCDIELATLMLQQLTNLIVNKKDKYNRPIPKQIECSHYPNVYWEYVSEDVIDVENDFGSISVKAKLTVPSGTSYNKEDTVTNTVGYVQGLAAVNPFIIVKPNNEQIEILEETSNQKFTIKYPNSLWSDKLVEIDCYNRQVLLKADEDDIDPVDISGYADKDVDWFSLYGEYKFSTINCTLRTVTYNERW